MKGFAYSACWKRHGVLCVWASFLSCWSLVAGETPATAPESATPEEPVEYRNVAEVSLGGLIVEGDRAQFQQRFGLAGEVYGGVEALHLEKDFGSGGLLKIDGHAIFDNRDYDVQVEYSQDNVGFLRGGFREFRTWYDGGGGFFPRNGRWFSLYGEDLPLDRGEAWVEAGFRRDGFPQITVRYSHQFRNGRKDSTIWGDSSLTGLLMNNVRGIVPTFLDIDEKRDIVTLDISHSIGNTDLGVGLRYEKTDNDNSRNIRRRPGEPSDRYVTQREEYDSDMFSSHTFTETRLGEKLRFTTGYAFTTLDSDVSGSRIYGAGYDAVYDPLFARRQQRDEGFLHLNGGGHIEQHVANVNLMWTPFQWLSIVPSVRAEKLDIDATSSFIETDVAGGGLSVQEPLAARSERDHKELTEEIEIRFKAVPNLVLYARGEWLQADGNLKERETDTTTNVADLFRDTDSRINVQKYVVGANCYPFPRVSIGTQYYHKIRENEYDHIRDSTPVTNPPLPPSNDLYPAFLTSQDFETDDANIRITWRLLNNLTLVSRYDFQQSTVDTQGENLRSVRSAEMKTHIFSESITWSPLARLFLQASVHYVLDETDTPADKAIPGVELVPDAKNNYWNATFTAGFAIDDKTNLQAQYNFYRADDYENNSAFSQPYGADAEEHFITLSLVRQINSNLRWMLKYGYFNNRDRTSGGHDNYQAHLVYSSLQYQF